MRRDLPSVAILIDYDNLEIGASFDLPGRPLDLGSIVELAQRYGTIVIARAYADWNDPNERLAVYESGIEPCFAPIFRTTADQPGKSLADTVLVADGVDILWRIAPDVLVLVTSDKDILPLARLARLRGTRTVVVGSDRTAMPLRRLADEYVTYRDLVRGTGVPVASHQRAGLVPITRGTAASARLAPEARPAAEPRRPAPVRPVAPAEVRPANGPLAGRPAAEAVPPSEEAPPAEPAAPSRRRRRRRGRAGAALEAAGRVTAAGEAAAAPEAARPAAPEAPAEPEVSPATLIGQEEAVSGELAVDAEALEERVESSPPPPPAGVARTPFVPFGPLDTAPASPPAPLTPASLDRAAPGPEPNGAEPLAATVTGVPETIAEAVSAPEEPVSPESGAAEPAAAPAGSRPRRGRVSGRGRRPRADANGSAAPPPEPPLTES